MGTKMTERDKKLLAGLFLFLLGIFCIFCVLRPLKNMERRYTQKLEKEKTAMRENKKKMETLPEMQEKNEESQARLSSLSENFFPEMTSMEIEKMFTRLSLDQGATVLDIDIVN